MKVTLPHQLSPEWRGNPADDRVTQVFSAILEPDMDPTHSVAALARFAPQQHTGFDLAALPDDVLPNIFSRLPAPEIFAISSVSKRFLHCSRPVMRDWALRELYATLELPSEQHWKMLFDVMRNGVRHIAPEKWQAWLQAAKLKGHNIELIQMAQLAPCVSGEVDSLKLVANNAPLGLTKRTRRELMWLAQCSKSHPWMGDVAVAIIAGAMLQQIQTERAQTARRTFYGKRPAGWDEIIECLRSLSLNNQIQTLAQAAPSGKDAWHVGHGIGTMWQHHIKAMTKGRRTPWPPEILKPARTANYFRMLQRQTRGWGIEPQRFILRLLCAWFKPPFRFAPWREQPSELSECLLIALGYGQIWGESHDELCDDVVASGFITEAEMTDFNNCVFNHRSLDINPVHEWIADNREKAAKINSCTIS